MALTTETLRTAGSRLAAAADTLAPELNTLDGQIGDGDLGVTLQLATGAMAEVLLGLPDDVGLAFMQCAQAVTRAASSSFGTLLATALMSAAKATKGRTDVPWTDIPALLAGAIASIKQRGKADLGDKTVLDALEAARLATDGLDDPAAQLAAADAAIAEALEAFCGRPNKVGRARIWADRTIGLDDPGMVALKRIVESLRG
ncbi:MAG: DAK2 domain-containing protein [Acetobacteraceae bacterium]|nr:DAK2 domain-containing protein [Acetobacteraceae bacterium]